MGIDAFLGILLLFVAFRGFQYGFARQMLQLVGLGLGFLFADPIARRIAPFLQAKFGAIPETVQVAMIYLATVFAIWFCISVPGAIYLALYRRRVFGDNLPSMGDRLFGLGLGLAKGAFIAVLIAWGVERLPEAAKQQSLVAAQVDESKGLKMAARIQVIPRILQMAEIKHFKEHCTALVRYFGHLDESAGPDSTAPMANQETHLR